MRWVYLGLLLWAVMSIPVALFMGLVFALGVGRTDGDDDSGDDDGDGLEFDQPYGDVVVAFPGMEAGPISAPAERAHESPRACVSDLLRVTGHQGVVDPWLASGDYAGTDRVTRVERSLTLPPSIRFDC